LKRKILTHPILPFFPNLSYLSDAPQAVPHAAGFSSGLSAAPQAVPHAAGFSSGLSAAPQAVPHAVLVFAYTLLFHPKRFDNAIFVSSSDSFIFRQFPCCRLIIARVFPLKKYALFYYIGTFL
jgi:hypothetical protein